MSKQLSFLRTVAENCFLGDVWPLERDALFVFGRFAFSNRPFQRDPILGIKQRANDADRTFQVVRSKGHR